jgi:hypothetical protein
MKLLSNIRNRYRQLIFNFKSYPLREDFQSGRVLFFVTGRSKSGTTWMGRLLNSHPELFCDVSENTAFHQDFEFTYFGKPTSSHHKAVGQFFESRTWTLLKNGLITNLICRCNKLSAKRFGDKTPRQDLDRIFDVFPNTQVIVMVRDFRDVCVSLAFHQQRVTGTWRGSFASEDRKSLDNRFVEYTLKNYEAHQDFKKYMDYSARLPEQVFMVRYEDLKSDPYNTLEKVLDFLKVESSPSIARKCIGINTFEKLSRGRKPGEEDSSHFFRKGITGDWRNYFSQENIEIFKQIAGSTLIAAGYEKDNNWTT